MGKNISFGIAIASRNYIFKYHEIVDDIIKHIIKIKPCDIMLTDKSNLYNLATEEDFIKRTFDYFNFVLTSKQFHEFEMSDYIKLILKQRKRNRNK